MTSNESEYIKYKGPSLNYSSCLLKEKEIRIQPCRLLFENKIIHYKPAVEEKEGKVTFLFPDKENKEQIFDPLAASFYLLSRYEEYFSFIPDKFDRFEATSSLSFSSGLLLRPLVNEWSVALREQLLELFPSLTFDKKKFSSIISIDIDQAFAFKHRGIYRNVLSLANNLVHLQKEWLKEQLKVILFNRKDPYNTYSYLKQLQIASRLSFIYFINVGEYSRFDKNLNINNPDFQKLLIVLNRKKNLGLHPSYFTNEKPGKFKEEKEKLETVIGASVNKSRQHYLKLKIPDTYRYLIEAGIKEDYSMGYASQPGFRAGTCTPFMWFDLEKNYETELKIFPITFMEGTLAEDLQLSPSEALLFIHSLVEIVKKYEGCFVPVWHNHTINDRFFWKGWKVVFEQMIEKIKCL